MSGLWTIQLKKALIVRRVLAAGAGSGHLYGLARRERDGSEFDDSVARGQAIGDEEPAAGQLRADLNLAFY